jgi:hypothetical protein
VFANGRKLASRPLARRRFSLRVALAARRLSQFAGHHRDGADGARRAASTTSSGCPAGHVPRVVAAHEDAALPRKITPVARGFSRDDRRTTCRASPAVAAPRGTRRSAFPGASTMKLAIAAPVSPHTGDPCAESQVSLLSSMLTPRTTPPRTPCESGSADRPARGSQRVNELMRSIGMRDSEMYGGYELRTLASRILFASSSSPHSAYGKHTTAWDIATLLRAVWLASGGRGPLRVGAAGLHARRRSLPALAPRARQRRPKLDRVRAGNPGVASCTRPDGNEARHDSGLVFWRGGVFVASVMTWSSRGRRCRPRTCSPGGSHAGVSAPVRASRAEFDAALAVVGTVSEPTTALTSARKRES